MGSVLLIYLYEDTVGFGKLVKVIYIKRPQIASQYPKEITQIHLCTRYFVTVNVDAQLRIVGVEHRIGTGDTRVFVE